MFRPTQFYLSLFTMTLGAVITLAMLRADQPTPTKGGTADNAPMKMGFAGTPKPLSDSVKKGLEFLVKEQRPDGGWGQGGGWRNPAEGKIGGGRIEGKNVDDPSDVGNTCIAVLALIRAGNTPTEGPYAKNVAKALDYIFSNVEKSDEKTIYVTAIRGTQLQGKIGPFVDTFLTSLVLAEMRGRMGDENGERRLAACLTKTVAKIERNMQQDGTFAGNNAWASVLSQGIANWGLNRAAQAGAPVNMEAIAKVQKQVVDGFDAKKGEFKSGAAGSDAGVAIYNQSANFRGAQDLINTSEKDLQKAKETIANKDAPKEEKDKAQKVVDRVEEIKKVRDEATKTLVRRLDDKNFVAGFGNNGGEEFLSFLNISESLVVKGGEAWQKWDKAMADSLGRAQDKDGSWAGHHCITGKTFCTAGALLVLMADRTPVPVVDRRPESK